jgi:hypothetical protein
VCRCWWRFLTTRQVVHCLRSEPPLHALQARRIILPKEAVGLMNIRVWRKHRAKRPAQKSRGRGLPNLSARVGLCLGAVGLAVVALIVVFGGEVLNGVVKGKIERAFARAHPGSALRLGHLRYSVGANVLVAESASLSATNLTCTASQISLTGVRWGRLLWGRKALVEVLAHAGLDATNLHAEFPQALYQLRCARVRASVPGSELLLQGTDLYPVVGDEVFFAADTFRRTRFRLAVPECRVLGLAYGELLEGKSYRAGSIHLAGGSFDALVNRDKPVRPAPKSPLMLQEALAAIRQPLHVDHLSITNAHLRYGERVVAGAAPGVLTFGDASLYVEGLANRREGPEAILIRAQSEFMKGGVLKVQLSIPVGSPDVSFRYAGSLGAMELTRLNAFLEIAEHTRILSGGAQGVLFEIDVAGGRARGRVQALYRDLKIAVLDSQTGSEKGLENRVASFFANVVKLRHSNPTVESGPMREGKLDYTRKPQDTFLQFLWFALRRGVLDAIGL